MEKILLIFGASGFLGGNVAKELSKKDFSKIFLFGSSIDIEESENVKNIEVEDLSKEENVEVVFSNLELDSDAQYFMFNAVGGYSGGTEVREMEMNEWTKMININLNISFLLAKYFFILCKSGKGGAACFTSAMTSFDPTEKKSAYGTSKSALNYLIKTLSKEGKNYNISVNAIAPLILDTEENRKWVKDESLLIDTKEISEVVFALFERRRIISGNIVELPFTLR